ncbi:MAG: exodeoxyribonuclease VII small subunit [Calditrichota bacterium]
MSPKEQSQKSTSAEPKSFEEALHKLEALVEELEGGDIPLEQSVKVFQDGQKLIAFCEQKLKAAEQALKQLAREADEMLGDDADKKP